MIKQIIDRNMEVKPNSKKLEALKEYFAGCFTAKGAFDIERFRDMMKDEVDISNEGYSLDFLGKDYANLIASIDTTTVIEPDIEHNEKPENKDSENIYISGDNLDALKHLLKSYAGKVKCIYIDPPYNTGSDGFVYNDKFRFTPEELEKKLSIDEDEAKRILDLTSRGSSTHSAWLMFMSPRLQLARELLSKDGVIFISIDDNEQANLKLLCDYVFGEENFVAQFVWISKTGGGSDNNEVVADHEYVLCYSKSAGAENAISRILLEAELYAKEHGITMMFLTSDALQYLFACELPHLEAIYPMGTELVNKVEENWSGWGKYYPDEKEMVLLYADPKVNTLGCKTNEFAKIYEGKELKDVLFWNGQEYTKLKYKDIKNPYIGETVKPRNIE
jgi:type III restriction enzyme/adenine-specific DNA-methyltransferase